MLQTSTVSASHSNSSPSAEIEYTARSSSVTWPMAAST